MMSGKIRAAICCAFLVIAFIAGFIGVQGGVPVMPHRFYGYVTVAGEPAPDGTLVEARIANITYASTMTVDGMYDFKVPGDDPETPEKEGGKTGDTIDFYVAGTYAASYTFEYGEITPLNLTVAAPTPYADFAANVTSGPEPLTVEFIDQSMYFDSIESYAWDFGDGNITVTSSPSIVHTYVQNGTYTVSLTVNGTRAGEIVVDTEAKVNYIEVYDTEPTADFYAEPTSGLKPLTVSFYDNSTSYDGIVAWEWDFGDGTNSTERNPTHTYTEAGTYTVKLTVIETDGDTDMCIKENCITVEETAVPTVTILSPTMENPIYTQSGKTIQITIKYTEQNPLNGTIKIYNATYTVLEMTTTEIAAGTNVTQTIIVEIPVTALEGKYSLSVTLYNIYNLSSTDIEENAVVIDNTPPIISNPYQDPPGQIVEPGQVVEVNVGQNVTVRVNVTDLTSDVKQVILCYNVTANEWRNITMQHTEGNEYMTTVPLDALPVGATVFYYIIAIDNANNVARLPINGVSFQFYVIPEFSTVAIILVFIATTLLMFLKRKKIRLSPSFF